MKTQTKEAIREALLDGVIAFCGTAVFLGLLHFSSKETFLVSSIISLAMFLGIYIINKVSKRERERE